MAKAYKCDWCGCLFDPKDFPDEQFVKCDEIRIITGKTYEDGRPFIKHINQANFCVMCSKRFMKEEAPREETQSDRVQSNRDMLLKFVDSVFLGGSKRGDGKSNDNVCNGESAKRTGVPVKESEN
jgi:hypothetical protein